MECMRRGRGFTLVEIMTVVLLIGIILAIAIPSFINSRQKSRATVCVRNLSRMDMAKEEWAMANNLAEGAPVTMDQIVSSFIKYVPQCPSGGTYTVNPVGTAPTCSVGGEHSL